MRPGNSRWLHHHPKKFDWDELLLLHCSKEQTLSGWYLDVLVPRQKLFIFVTLLSAGVWRKKRTFSKKKNKSFFCSYKVGFICKHLTKRGRRGRRRRRRGRKRSRRKRRKRRRRGRKRRRYFLNCSKVYKLAM